eukprot:3775035-Amphidinium_carterae.1
MPRSHPEGGCRTSRRRTANAWSYNRKTQLIKAGQVPPTKLSNRDPDSLTSLPDKFFEFCHNLLCIAIAEHIKVESFVLSDFLVASVSGDSA